MPAWFLALQPRGSGALVLSVQPDGSMTAVSPAGGATFTGALWTSAENLGLALTKSGEYPIRTHPG